MVLSCKRPNTAFYAGFCWLGADYRLLSVGTSAGGARAKAVLAWNPKTGEFRSGQLDAEAGFEHWLLKFDGVSNNMDKEPADPQGYGRIEYAYALMAHTAGITMSECRLHHEGGRSHFMTKRFDRDDTGRKIHMQSLGAMQHFDFNDPSAYSYEQAVMTIRDLDLGDDLQIEPGVGPVDERTSETRGVEAARLSTLESSTRARQSSVAPAKPNCAAELRALASDTSQSTSSRGRGTPG